ncbi:hypothetical protein BDV10DRAFT_200208 [Aspergillus recurvatus]
MQVQVDLGKFRNRLVLAMSLVKSHAPPSLVWATGDRSLGVYKECPSLSNLEEKGIEAFPFDAASAESIQALKEEIVTRTGGKLDLLFNNAGMVYEAPAIEADAARIRTIFSTNVHGLFNMVSAFTPVLVASSVQNAVPLVIINTASILARIPFPFSAAYNASKAAPLGIKVVTLFMGEVRTRLMSPEDICFGSEKSRNHAENSMSPEEFAAQIIREILVKSPVYGKGGYLWKGTNAWLIWLLDAMGWRKVFDGTVKKLVGLDKREIQDSIIGKARAAVG